MKTDSYKNWMDAFRESFSHDEAALSPGHWESLCKRMHRRKIIRRSLSSAMVLFPLIGLIILFPSKTPALIPSKVLALNPTLPVLDRLEDAPVVRVANITRHPRPVGPFSTGIVLQEESETMTPKTICETETGMDEKEWQLTQADERTSIEDSFSPEREFFKSRGQVNNKQCLLIGIHAGLAAAGEKFSYAKQDYLSYINRILEMDTKAITGSNSSAVPTNISYSHSIPLEIGFLLQIPVSHSFAFESGIEYTYLRSVENNNGVLSRQQLHLIGVPLRINLLFSKTGPFDWYAGAGITVEKCVAASLGKLKCDEPDLQWSADMSVGVQYHLGPHFSLFVQPSANWYLTETRLITYRTQNPLGFSFQTGLRYRME